MNDFFPFPNRFGETGGINDQGGRSVESTNGIPGPNDKLLMGSKNMEKNGNKWGEHRVLLGSSASCFAAESSPPLPGSDILHELRL